MKIIFNKNHKLLLPYIMISLITDDTLPILRRTYYRVLSSDIVSSEYVRMILKNQRMDLIIVRKETHFLIRI